MNRYSIGSWEIAINRRIRTPAGLARKYDAASAKWVQISRIFRLDNTYQQALLASSVLSVLGGGATGARVLDCGIGSGSLSLALNNIVTAETAFYGIDVSNKMLGTADAEMRQVGMKPELQRANILSIPHPDHSFDIVMAAHVLEHLPEPQLALEEMIRVLRPGGVLFVCITRPSVFGTLIQLLWRTWAVTEKQGVAWLRNCQLKYIGYQPVNLGPWAGRGSTAFWAQKPNRGPGKPQQVSSTSAEACSL